jgi:Co/Zn/Cd efflux system component
MWLTLAMMVVEIAAGTVLGSMALLADGWHMSSHALKLGVSAFANYLARRHAHARKTPSPAATEGGGDVGCPIVYLAPPLHL